MAAQTTTKHLLADTAVVNLGVDAVGDDSAFHADNLMGGVKCVDHSTSRNVEKEEEEDGITTEYVIRGDGGEAEDEDEDANAVVDIIDAATSNSTSKALTPRDSSPSQHSVSKNFYPQHHQQQQYSSHQRSLYKYSHSLSAASCTTTGSSVSVVELAGGNAVMAAPPTPTPMPNPAYYLPYTAALLQQRVFPTAPTHVPQHSPFHSVYVPPITIHDYAHRFMRHGRCSPECLLLSVIFIDRFLTLNPHIALDAHSVHRLFLAAIVLAIKSRDDVYFSNKYYGQIGGIGAKEMNQLELTMLAGLNWNLWVDLSEFHDTVGYGDTAHRLLSGPTPPQPVL